MPALWSSLPVPGGPTASVSYCSFVSAGEGRGAVLAFHGSIEIDLCGSQFRVSSDHGAGTPLMGLIGRSGANSSNAQDLNTSRS